MADFKRVSPKASKVFLGILNPKNTKPATFKKVDKALQGWRLVRIKVTH